MFSAIGFHGNVSPCNTWYTDSGASNHMTMMCQDLSDLKPYTGPTCVHTTKGDKMIVSKNGDSHLSSLTLHDVLYVHYVSHNRLIISQLIDNNYSILFSHDDCFI